MSGQELDTPPAEVVTTIRLPKSQHDALKARAESEHRTLSGHVRFLIERHLAADTTPTAAA